MAITTIKKRNGEIVDFAPLKISAAVAKAFLATGTPFTQDSLTAFTESVVEKAEIFFASGAAPQVENIQDIVEKTLMERGYFDAAKAYILYRKEHEKQRIEKQQEIIEKIEKKELFVVKSSGKKEKFNEEKLRKTLAHAARGYEGIVDIEALVGLCKEAVYDEITTKDIRKALVMTVRSWIEQDPAYSAVAERLLLRDLYKRVIGDNVDFDDLERSYREAFVNNVKDGVKAGVLDERLLEFDLKKMSQKLTLERDEIFTYMGLQTLYDRYFARDATTGRIFETPQGFWMRVAMGIALAENKKSREEHAEGFYNLISALLFVPSTPTLFNAGTTHPQLSSCYLTTVEDDLAHIFKCIGDNAQLSKWSGGLGNDWTNLRGTGALIKKTGVESQGIIPFLKIANDTTVAINRSGKRRGATCAYLETWHYDIEDFLELRKNTGDERRRAHDMNTANWVPDLFMKRVQEDGDWTLLSPDETPDLHHIYGKEFEKRYTEYEKMVAEGKLQLYKVVKARDLWKKMISMLFETGHPWITFKDPCNIRSPQDHVGVVHSSNLCTEITLNTSAQETAVCNLGSVNLARHVKDKKFDWAMMGTTVGMAMRMLDNVIDVNFYPTPEAKAANLRHRPVGLGVLGFQDALYMMDIRFDSEECVALSDEMMEQVSYHAILASAELARERGTYESYKGSKWERGIFPIDTVRLLEEERGIKTDVDRRSRMDWTAVRTAVQKNGMRNSNCMAIAPTATISTISGTVPSIEPIYKNIYVKSNQTGEFVVVNAHLVADLKERNLWDYEMLGKIKYNDGSIATIKEIPDHLKEKYKETFEVDPVWVIKAAAYRGKWIDQSQSVNIFFKGTSGRDISNLYVYAWAMGLKTTYYLRTLAISQVEKSTVNAAEFGTTHKRSFAPVPGEREIAGVSIADSGTKQLEVSPVASSAVVMSENIPPPSLKLATAGGPKLCAIDDPTCEACQ
ncbi:MAG: ribonucleoside-diphosphate reductase subunit alpha [Patescibacteria group bacterium]